MLAGRGAFLMNQYNTTIDADNNSKEKTPNHKLFETFGATFSLNGSVSEAVGDKCPFCDKENHCYFNIENGLYDCKSCGASGNAFTFVRHEYEQALESTSDADYRRLSRLRDLSLQTLKRFGLAKLDDSSCWLIPFKSSKGKVLNLVRYFPKRKDSKCRNLSGLPVCLYGVDQMSYDADRLFFLCEGPWDAMALDQHLRQKKTRERYDVVAVPGATIFKEPWSEFFRGRKVRIVYDNDDAGRKGQDRAAKILLPTTTDLSVLQWP